MKTCVKKIYKSKGNAALHSGATGGHVASRMLRLQQSWLFRLKQRRQTYQGYSLFELFGTP